MPQSETDMQEGAGTKAARVAEQTKIRLGLLKNGYTPLANRNKTCLLPGWPGLKITKALISDTWADQLRYCATGVRVDGRLVVLDFDIDDDDMLDAVYDALPDDLVDRICDAPTRKGKGAKVAVFMRLADGEGTFGRIVSQAYAPPGSDQTCRLEVFGSGEARQFGAFGPHSHDDDGAVAVSYRWVDGLSLLDVPLGELPEISRAEVLEVCDAASWAMREGGWEYEVKSRSGVVESIVAFTLDDDMEFETRDYGVLGLGELEDLCAGVGEGVRLSAGWLEGSSAVNTSRCIARLNDGDGRVQIWESADCRLYRPAALNVHSVVGRLSERLGQTAAGAEKVSGGSKGSEGAEVSEAGADAGVADAPVDRWSALVAAAEEKGSVFSDPSGEKAVVEAAEEKKAEEEVAVGREFVVNHLLDRYAYWASGAGYVVDIESGLEAAMSVASFKNLMAPFNWTEKKSARKNAAEVEVSPVDHWVKSEQRKTVNGYKFLPDSRDQLVDRDGKTFVNLWERPAWWDQEISVDEDVVTVFQTFLEHLIPDERERTWFTMWLAAKTQKAWLPNCGVILVAERQGTGRGTLFDMLTGVFGRRHVKNVSAMQMFGGGGQSQYTDWIEQSLLVTCDEVLTGDDVGGAVAWKRREVYEKLKTLVDPRPRSLPIVRKGLPNDHADVFASFLLATNNINALPLSPDDRRIAVVTNTGTPLVERGDVLRMLEPWRTDVGFSEAFCVSLYGWLRGLDVHWSEVRESPRWMEGRERMLSANESDLEGVLENVLSSIDGDYILGHHLRERMGRSLEANGLINDVKGWWAKTQDLLGRINRFGWRKMDGRHKYAPGRVTSNTTVVFYRDVLVTPGTMTQAEAWKRASLEEREKLWASGSETDASKIKLAARMKEKGISGVVKES